MLLIYTFCHEKNMKNRGSQRMKETVSRIRSLPVKNRIQLRIRPDTNLQMYIHQNRFVIRLLLQFNVNGSDMFLKSNASKRLEETWKIPESLKRWIFKDFTKFVRKKIEHWNIFDHCFWVSISAEQKNVQNKERVKKREREKEREGTDDKYCTLNIDENGIYVHKEKMRVSERVGSSLQFLAHTKIQVPIAKIMS